MDLCVAILATNGTGKSMLLNLITSQLQSCEGTISKHANLKLAKYSQHSANQLLYDKSPIKYFDSLYSAKYPDKDMMVHLQSYVQLLYHLWSDDDVDIVMASAAWMLWSFWGTSNHTYQTIIRWPAQLVFAFYMLLQFESHGFLVSVMFSQLTMEYPHILLLGKSYSNI